MRILLSLLPLLLAAPLYAAPFTAGNLVVYRVGDGVAGLANSGAPVFLDEYATDGTLVQSLALPVTAASGVFPLIASGTATSEGLLTRSADRRFLLLTGYGRALGGSGSLSGTAAAVVPRVLGRVDASGVIDTSTALTDFADANNPRSAVSTQGTDVWLAGGAGGVRFATLGASTSTQINAAPTNFRQLAIVDGQLLVSTSSGSSFRLAEVASGLPTDAGQTLVNLPGLPTNSGSPYAYVFFDLSVAVPGVDTLYLADDSIGLQKYSLVAGTWTLNGSIGGAADLYRGLAGVLVGSEVRLYATRLGGSGAAGGGQLVSLSDASGHGGNFAASATVLVTAANNTALRGVAMAPEQDLPPLGPLMRVTEYMYQGADGEFVEFTNVGDQPADLSGWSFDDDSRVPGSFPLDAFGTVQPGESVILTEAGAAAFRAAWGLCDGQKVIGDLNQNLGRNDEINLYDATNAQVDRLSYGDQNFPGSIRTQARSGWVSAAGLGVNNALEWTLSVLADGEASVASAGADLASPGRSTRVLFEFDPCQVEPNAPTVSVDLMSTSDFLDIPVNSGGAVGAVIDDPTDPAASVGIGFVFDDPAGDPSALVIEVSSNNPDVLAPAGLVLTGSGSARQLRIQPNGVGRAQITVVARAPDLRQGQYVIDYAASAASVEPAATRWHAGASDASTGVAISDTLMLVADDENQVLRLYRRDLSGLHLAGFDFTAQLGLSDLSGGLPREVDIEASTRIGDRIYWSGSHGNQASAPHNPRPNRRRIYATDLNSGVLPTLSYVGRYDHLAEDLIAWDAANGHGLGAGFLDLAASAAPGVSPESVAGFNLEGLAAAEDGSAWIAFRAPLLPAGARTHALLVPVQSLDALVAGAASGSLAAGSASFGAPLLVDLGGRGIRSIERSSSGDYLIVAGPVPGGAAATTDFRLYRWSGDPLDAPVWLPARLAERLVDGSYEALIGLPHAPTPGSEVQLLVDNGDTVYYADGVIAKELAERRQAKFRGERIEVLDESVFGNGFESP